MNKATLIKIDVITCSLEDGETFIRIMKSGWATHYDVVQENAIEEYDPTVECLREEEIAKKYKIENLKELLEKLYV